MSGLASVATAVENRATRARAAVATSPALRAALPPFVAAKIVAFLVPVLVVWSTTDIPGHPGYQDIVGTFSFWDGAHYISIAEHGYPGGPLDLIPNHSGFVWGFFPGLPILLRAGMFIFRDATTTGILISIAGEFLALFFLARLVLLERHGDEGTARFACWMLAFFPSAVFLSLVYTESVFMAAAIASLYYMRRGSNTRACVAAAVAGAVRITGLVLVPVLLVEYLSRRRGRPRRGVIAIAATVTPVLVFCWYAWHLTGNAFAYMASQQSASFGNRLFAAPWAGLWRTLEIAHGNEPSSYNYIFISDALWGMAGLLALWYFAVNWRRFAPSLTLFSGGVWLLATSLTYWTSLMRYEIAFIPIYLAAADLWRRRPQTATVVLAVSAAWMVFATYTFVTGRFVA